MSKNSHRGRNQQQPFNMKSWKQELQSRVKFSEQLQQVEFNQSTSTVTKSLLKAKQMYIMSVAFALAPWGEEITPEKVEQSPEVVQFVDLARRNALTSKCVFIPFRSINSFLDEYPLTIFTFVKYCMNTFQPVCIHLVYREDGSNKVDTFKDFFESYAKLKEIANDGMTRMVCSFEEDEETKELNVSVKQLV